MRYKRSCLLLIGALVTLSACGRTRTQILPASAAQVSQAALDEDELKNRALTYVEAFRQGQFDSFYQEADEILKKTLPREQLEQKWNEIMTDARAYSGSESVQATQAGGKTRVQVTSVHGRYNVISDFIFSSEGMAEELSVKRGPLNVVPQAGEKWEEFPIQLGYDPEKLLNGMLTLPKHTDNPPVVILVHGSGAQGMDSLIGAADNRPFADLAWGLAENGIASIRYDKRSYAYPEDVTDIQTEYLNDVRAAVDFALQETRVNGNSLYLIGHSQGGMLSPKFALDNPEIKGIVSLGGTLRRIEDIILEQNETMMAQNNTLSGQEKAAHIAGIKKELDRVHALTPDSADDRDEMLLGYPVSYWISLNAIDQQAIAEKLTIPMLILQGGNDFQVRYDTDFKLWEEVLGGRENVTFRDYPGLSHVFMPGSLEHFDSSSYDAPARMDDQVIRDIAGWIHSLRSGTATARISPAQPGSDQPQGLSSRSPVHPISGQRTQW